MGLNLVCGCWVNCVYFVGGWVKFCWFDCVCFVIVGVCLFIDLLNCVGTCFGGFVIFCGVYDVFVFEFGFVLLVELCLFWVLLWFESCVRLLLLFGVLSCLLLIIIYDCGWIVLVGCCFVLVWLCCLCEYCLVTLAFACFLDWCSLVG